jgi:hypothetical protein
MLFSWYNRTNMQKPPRALETRRGHGRCTGATIMSISQEYYVYILARPNGTPFYVGKGKGPRIWDHEQEARRGCRCHRCNVIRKIWRGGGEVQRYTILTTNNEKDAYQYERDTIALHGRANLVNRNDGGEGGGSPSEETRRKLSVAAKGRPSWNKGKSVSDEMRQRISAALKGRPLDPQRRDAFVKVNIGRKWQPESVEKSRQKRTGLKRTIEQREHAIAIRRKGRTYTLTSPTGEVYTDVISIAVFAEQHGLNAQCLHQVCRGAYKQHRGWKCHDNPT